MHLFNRKSTHPGHSRARSRDQEKVERGNSRHGNSNSLPTHNHNGHRVTPGIEPDGESGRRGFHPWHFVRICFRSSSAASKWTNLLWPFVIAAMVLHFAYGNEEKYPNLQLWVFITAYVGMVPSANLLGFAGQELARKIPKVAGIILETTLGSIVEIILFMVLLREGGERNVPVIQAAILGSILANLLLCLGTILPYSHWQILYTDGVIQDCASSSAAFSARSKPSTRPSAKWVVILCSSRAWAL